MPLLLTLAFALISVAVLMAGLGIKILVKKHGEFKRHCASVDPFTGKRSGCICGKMAQDDCKSSPEYHPLEVNKELLNEANVK